MHKSLRNMAAAMLLAGGLAGRADGEIAWGDSFEAAKAKAKSDGKLLLVDFWRDG